VGLIRSLVDLYFDGPAPRGRIEPLVEAQEPRYRNPFNINFHCCKINLYFIELALRCEPDNWCVDKEVEVETFISIIASIF
jgi:hypothetical protein